MFFCRHFSSLRRNRERLLSHVRRGPSLGQERSEQRVQVTGQSQKAARQETGQKTGRSERRSEAENA